jgi:hypothetical protein
MKQQLIRLSMTNRPIQKPRRGSGWVLGTVYFLALAPAFEPTLPYGGKK